MFTLTVEHAYRVIIIIKKSPSILFYKLMGKEVVRCFYKLQAERRIKKAD